MSLSLSEENYLKTIYHLSNPNIKGITTNSIADNLKTKPSSVTDMLKKLATKDLVHHIKYYGVNLTDKGRKEALSIVRKHRLWEVFLVDKLKYNWDEVHDIAEQLEHIASPTLIDRLNEFLGFPTVDPHGDPIPDEDGKIKIKPQKVLTEAKMFANLKVVGLKETTAAFLKYLDKTDIAIGSNIKIMEKVEFDGSMEIVLENTRKITISDVVASNLLVTEN